MHTVEAFLDSPEGRSIRLHSGRDPVGEAARWLDGALPGGEPEFLVLLGAGLGYVFDALETRAERPRVLLIESDPALLAAMRARRDWSAWLDSGRLIVLSGPDYAGQGDAWRHVPRPEIDWPVLAHPVLLRERPAAIMAARAVAERILFDARANADSRTALAGTYLLHTLANTGVIAREGNAGALFEAFPGVPAIVIGAGPSLDRHLDALATVGDRALMIAADTALRPLLSAGVAPQIALAADPSDANARHLQDLPPCGATWLVAEGSVGSGAFATFAGRAFVFRLGTHEPWPWLESLGLARASLRAWGSVVTSAFDLAIRAGCDPIIFAGLDLAFTRERPYCRGVTWEEDWAHNVLRGGAPPPLETTWHESLARWKLTTERGVDGQPVTTAPHLQAFRNWIVEQTAALGRRVVNGTGAGILAGGRVEQQDLARAVRELLPAAPLDLHTVLRRAHGARDATVDRERWRAAMTDAVAGSHALAPGDPMSAWLAFAPNVEPDAIRHSLEAARALSTAADAAPVRAFVIETPIRSASDGLLESIRVPPPERAAILRSALDDRPVPPWARQSRDIRLPADVDARSIAHALEIALRAGGAPTERFEQLLAACILCSGGDRPHELAQWRLLTAWLGWQPEDTALPPVIDGLLSRSRWPSPDPREPFHGSPNSVRDSPAVDRVKPRILTEEGVERGVAAATYDLRHAIVTPYGALQSVLIAEDGSYRRLPAWPEPIVAEMPWGSDGGALAWRNGENPVLMHRRSSTAAPMRQPLPFQPGATMLQRDDGGALFPSHQGGLWTWTPDGGVHKVIEAPPCIGISRCTGGIRLDPVARDAQDQPVRCIAPEAWLRLGNANGLAPLPLDARGQRWSMTVAGPWTAAAFPHADLVHLADGTDTAFELACDYPVAVAWAGQSLVVISCDGTMRLFRNLRQTLDRQPAAAPRTTHG